MRRQIAIGAVIGFTLTVIALSLWERPAGDVAPPDAGVRKDPPFPSLELRGQPIEALPIAAPHAKPIHFKPRLVPDGGP